MPRKRKPFPGLEDGDEFGSTTIRVREITINTEVGANLDIDELIVRVIRAMGGVLVIDDQKITILMQDGTVYDTGHGYAFRNLDNSKITGGLFGTDFDAIGDNNTIDLRVIKETGHDAQLNIYAESNSTEEAVVSITADDNNSEQSISLQAGTTTPQISMAGDMLNLNTKVVILPRITTSARNGLTAVNGMLIYNMTVGRVQAYVGGAWTNL